MRQDHLAESDIGVSGAEPRPGADRRKKHGRHRSEPSTHGVDIPEFGALSSDERLGKTSHLR